MQDETPLQVLAQQIANQIKGAPARPKLRLVRTEDLAPPQGNGVTRMCRLDRVRWLVRTYRLRMIADQYTFGRAGIDTLEDDELRALHSALEKARECIVDGTPLDEVPGLIRNMDPADDEWDAA